MKKLFVSLFLVIALSLFVSACAPATGFAQNFVELPAPLEIAVLSFVTFLVGYIFTKIAEALPPLAGFLGQYVDEVSTAVAGAVVLAIQTWLHAIPPEWEGVANAALALLVAVLAAIQLIKLGRKARVPGFRS